MEPASRLDRNGQLTLQEFPYVIQWREDRCTRCGRCTAVCPQQAIEPAVFAQRLVYSESGTPVPSTVRKISHGIRQVTDIERYCTGCGICSLVCPNVAIAPYYNPRHKFLFHKNLGGTPYKRGGRRNDPSPSTLDKLKFTRISMLTDPALDAGRHEFHIRTLLGRIPSPDKLPLKVTDSRLIVEDDHFIPPVREIFPIRIGSMSIGALSPNMWEGLAMGITYLNEVEGIPVVMCSGEGGMPPRLLRSRFLKYFIPQIASGYFGWDEIIHALPYMVDDPCAIEIKYGQGAKPGDGGLLMSYKVLKLIAGIRGAGGQRCPAARPRCPAQDRRAPPSSRGTATDTQELAPHLTAHPVSCTWRDSDSRIAFGKNKTHAYSQYTLTLKCIYGALPLGNKFKECHCERGIFETGIEYLSAFSVDFGLIDAPRIPKPRAAITITASPEPAERTRLVLG